MKIVRFTREPTKSVQTNFFSSTKIGQLQLKIQFLFFKKPKTRKSSDKPEKANDKPGKSTGLSFSFKILIKKPVENRSINRKPDR
jgi:hypothetical protein